MLTAGIRQGRKGRRRGRDEAGDKEPLKAVAVKETRSELFVR